MSLSFLTKDYQLGGEMIDSGGYGCIFSPALKCINKKMSKNIISKLMLRHNALDEYNLIQSIKQKIKTIPKYYRYFLVDNIYLCKPEPLSQKDLQNLDSCSALKKDNISVKNINNNLHKLLILHMPYGGITFDKCIEDTNFQLDFKRINSNLLDLLMNGILPMNQKHIYHCDIKSSNVLFDSTFTPRIIDWGFSNKYVPTFNISTIPEQWKSYSLQFNTPLSSAFFSDDFKTLYDEFSLQTGNRTYEFTEYFVETYVMNKKHYSVINQIFYMFYFMDIMERDDIADKKKWIEENYTKKVITKYLYDLIVHFSIIKNENIIEENITKYINNVYRYIVDVWGFLLCFLPEIELLYQNYEKLNEIEMSIFKQFKYIYMKYLYTPQFYPIYIPNLYNDLKRIDSRFIKNISPSKLTIESYLQYSFYKKKIINKNK